MASGAGYSIYMLTAFIYKIRRGPEAEDRRLRLRLRLRLKTKRPWSFETQARAFLSSTLTQSKKDYNGIPILQYKYTPYVLHNMYIHNMFHLVQYAWVG